jgi:hypothetical protein
MFVKCFDRVLKTKGKNMSELYFCATMYFCATLIIGFGIGHLFYNYRGRNSIWYFVMWIFLIIYNFVNFMENMKHKTEHLVNIHAEKSE